MGELIFRCPACSFSHKIDSARVPAAGVKGACRGCGAPLAVYPDGRVEGALSPAAPAAAPAPPREPGASALARFRCPYCGSSGERPVDGLDPAGTIAACGTCVQNFRLFPDGRTEEADGGAAPAPAPPAVAPPPVPGDLLQVACPFCGTPHERPRSDFDPSGTEIACRVCVMPFTVFPDGRVVEPPGAAGPPPAPPAKSALPPGVLAFSCPRCGKELRLPKEKLPSAGARGKCAGCQTRILLKPDGSAERIEESKPAPTGDFTRWQLQAGAAAAGPFSLQEVSELIGTGAVKPQSVLRPVGGEWAAAVAFAPIAALFGAGGGTPAASRPPAGATPAAGGEEGTAIEQVVELGSLDRCYAHADRYPERTCTQCNRHLCEECVVQKPFQGQVKPLPVCGACGGPTALLPKRIRWTPFYMDLGQVFAAPLKGYALLYLGFVFLLQVAKAVAGASPFGLLTLFFISVFQWVVYLQVIRGVANGSYELPEWPDSSHLGDMLTGFLKVVLVSLISLLPVLIVACILIGPMMGLMAATGATGNPAVAGLALGPVGFLFLLFFFFYLFYLPICIGIVAVFDTMVPALNPAVILRVIYRIGLPYVYAAMLWLALSIFNITVAYFAAAIPLLGAVAAALVDVYTTLVFCYSLGRVIAENDHKIGWA